MFSAFCKNSFGIFRSSDYFSISLLDSGFKFPLVSNQSDLLEWQTHIASKQAAFCIITHTNYTQHSSNTFQGMILNVKQTALIKHFCSRTIQGLFTVHTAHTNQQIQGCVCVCGSYLNKGSAFLQ